MPGPGSTSALRGDLCVLPAVSSSGGPRSSSERLACPAPCTASAAVCARRRRIPPVRVGDQIAVARRALATRARQHSSAGVWRGCGGECPCLARRRGIPSSTAPLDPSAANTVRGPVSVFHSCFCGLHAYFALIPPLCVAAACGRRNDAEHALRRIRYVAAGALPGTRRGDMAVVGAGSGGRLGITRRRIWAQTLRGVLWEIHSELCWSRASSSSATARASRSPPFASRTLLTAAPEFGGHTGIVMAALPAACVRQHHQLASGRI